MARPLIKICGITRREDALVALSAGADWLGFIRWSGSPRFRPLEDCAELLRSVRRSAPHPFQSVGVFVDAPFATILRDIEVAGFDRVQLHGSESPELVRSISVPVIKAIKIRDAASLTAAENYPGVDLLADAADPIRHGGTGKSYDAFLLRDLVKTRRVIVAGGLRPENVGEVVQLLHPYGVDVSSGVEISPGIKDRKKIRNFIKSVHRASEEVGRP